MRTRRGRAWWSDRRERSVVAAALTEIVRAYPGAASVPSSQLDDDQLQALAEANRVSCFLGPTIEAAGRSARAADRMRLVEIRRRFARSRTARDLQFVGDVLNAHGLDWLVLKGPALVDNAYRGAAREFGDIDLLVDGESLGQALDALCDAGAVMVDQNFDLLSAMGSGEVSLLLPNGTMCDLHWHLIHLLRVRRRFAIDTRSLLRSRVPSANDEAAFDTLRAVDFLLHICLHACLGGGRRLLWLKDIELCVRNLGVADDELVAQAHRWRAGPAVALMLHRVARVQGRDVDLDLVRRLSRDSRSWVWLVSSLDRTVGPSSVRRAALLEALYRSTRDTAGASARELAHVVLLATLFRRRADAARPWRAMTGPNGEPPMTVASAPAARSRFLQDVARESSSDLHAN